MDPVEQAKAKMEAAARQRAERAAHDAKVEAIRRQVLAAGEGASRSPASLTEAPPTREEQAPAVPDPTPAAVPVGRLVSVVPPSAPTQPGPLAPLAEAVRRVPFEARVGGVVAVGLIAMGCLAWSLVGGEAERAKAREAEAERLELDRREREFFAEQQRAEAEFNSPAAQAERARLHEAEVAKSREAARAARAEQEALRAKEEEAKALAAAERAERERKERAAEEEKAAALRRAEATSGRQPRRHPWDSSVICVETELKRLAHDPDSIECSEWTHHVAGELRGTQCWTVRFVYRGKNKLGHLVRHQAQAWIRDEKVLAIVDLN